MTVGNIEEINTALATLNEREASPRRSAVRSDHRRATAQSDLAGLSLLAADPGIGKLGEILARRLGEQRKSLLPRRHQGREVQKTRPSSGAALNARINARRQALSILSRPFTSYYMPLDMPLICDSGG